MDYFEIAKPENKAKVVEISNYLDKHPKAAFHRVAAHFAKKWGEPVEVEIVRTISFHGKPGATMDPLKPDLQTLVKLGSVYVHVKEWLGESGHRFDVAATKALLADPQLEEWCQAMDRLALLPVMR